MATSSKLDINTGAPIAAKAKTQRKNIAIKTHCLKLVIR